MRRLLIPIFVRLINSCSQPQAQSAQQALVVTFQWGKVKIEKADGAQEGAWENSLVHPSRARAAIF